MVVQSCWAIELVGCMYPKDISRVNLYQWWPCQGIKKVRNAKELLNLKLLTAKCR